MGFRELYEKHVKKWTAHIALGLLLLAVAIHVAHLLGVLEWMPADILVETLGFASLFLITLLLESIFASETRFDDFASESGKQFEIVNRNVYDLSKQIESTAGISGYSDLRIFTNKWQDLRDKFSSVTLVGELPIDFVEEVKRICVSEGPGQEITNDNEISIYRSLNTNSLKEINELIEIASQARPDLVKVFHTYGMEWGSWAMGTNNRGDETEVLLNYSNPHGNALAGLHLSGQAAESFAKAITPHFKEIGLPGVSYPPIRLASPEQIDFIVEEKVDYQKKIKEMVEVGVPIEGTDKICEAMSNLLRNTQETLNVTHLCLDIATIERLQDEDFQKWINENYRAVQRGVKIKRIFIVHRDDSNHKILLEAEEQMRKNGIEVLVCFLDDLRPRLREDFSIYDGQHLVYMDKARVYWSSTQEPLARRTESPVRIADYKSIFDSLNNAARK